MTGGEGMVTATCKVCGGSRFAHTHVLWDELVHEWGLSSEEAAYIDAQQGTHCVACGSNLRSIALADAIVRSRRGQGTLAQFVVDPNQASTRLLEINEAGTLSSLLRTMPGHEIVAYPAVDMQALPFSDASYDLVVHSDTLEHVPDPALGLRECRRVLVADGALVFTVPTVLGRLTRSRAGLAPSYHGAAAAADPLMLVHTEFGADLWTMVLSSGFASCEIVAFRFPSGLAVIARP